MILITIYIGIIIFVWLYNVKTDSRTDNTVFAVLLTVIVGGIICIPLALFAPLGGVGEQECVQEIELISIENLEQEGTWYVVKYKTASGSKHYLYAYDAMKQYSLEGKAYQEETMNTVENSIKEYESDECTRPILKKFEARGKKNWFSFAIGYKKEEWVFFVPTGTVLDMQNNTNE